MKNLSILIAGVLIGSLATGYITYNYWGKKMLLHLYFDTATDATRNMNTLKILKEGDIEHSVEVLEQFLFNNQLVLKGCKQDLCKKETPDTIEKALIKITKYYEESTN